MTESSAPAAAILEAVTLPDPTEALDALLAGLYDAHGEALYRYALALTGSADDAEDAVQDVFGALARRPGRVRRVRDVRAYLFTGVRNAAYSILRGRRRRGDLEQTLSRGLDTAAMSGIEAGTLDAVLLRAAFAALPIEQREVLALKVFEGMTFKEIAAATRTPPNTVASRYRYGIEKLRRALEEADDER